MGCDGGTIPRRDELVRLKKKPEQKDKDSERQFRWLHCALTQQRLQQPIVMCGLGRLYSKQNVIEQLLEKDKMPETAKHIKSLKDVKDLVLSPNPEFKDDDKTEGLLDARSAPFICKLIGIEMSGKFRFVALWSCGCVFSERALKEIKLKICVLCQTPFTDEDIVILNGNEEETELMRIKMESRITKRKTKKSKNKEINVTETSTSIKTPALTTTAVISTEPSTSTASTSQGIKIDPNGPVLGKLSRNNKIDSNKRSQQSAAAGKMEDPEIKRLKTDYSVAKDPKASNVYKSLFTSHKSEKEQTRAHWVTYNPFYN